MPDHTVCVILENIASLGYDITVGDGSVVAMDKQTRDVHRVTFDDGDQYKAACELARLAQRAECTRETKEVADTFFVCGCQHGQAPHNEQLGWTRFSGQV